MLFEVLPSEDLLVVAPEYSGNLGVPVIGWDRLRCDPEQLLTTELLALLVTEELYVL